MKKLFYPLWAVILPVMIVSGCCQSNEPPRLSLSVDSLDIGTVYIMDEPKSFDIEVRNDGGRELVIDTIMTTCDCTTIDYSHSPISAGRSTTLHFTFSGREFLPQEMVREVQIFSNDANSPKTFYFKVIVDTPNEVNDSCDSYQLSF